MDQPKGKKLDRIFFLSWSLFCAVYFLPGLIKGSQVPTSSIWLFERQVQFIPFMNFISNCWQSGIFPAWSPHFYSGFPYLAIPENFVYQPVFYLLAWMSYARHFFALHLLGFCFGGIAFYSALRKLNISAVASILGLLAFMGGHFFNVFAAYRPYTMFAWPFLAWSLAGIIQGQLRLRYFVAFVASFGAGISFDFEQGFYIIVGVVLFAICFGGAGRWKQLLLILIATELVTMFELGLFLNLAAYFPHTVRASGISFANFAGISDNHKLLSALSELLFPLPIVLPINYRGNYFGLTVLFLALFGVKRLGWRGVAAVILVLLFLLYSISWLPLAKALFHLPLINRLARHYTAAIVTVLGIAFLSAKGADEFLKIKSRISLILLMLVVCVVGLASLKADLMRSLGLLAALGLGAIALVFRLKRQWLLYLFVLFTVIFDVSFESLLLQPRASMKELADHPAVVKYLAAEKSLVRFWPLSIYAYNDTLVHPLVGMNLPADLPGTHSPLGYWRVPAMRNARLINLIAPGYLQLDSKGELEALDVAKPRDPKEIDDGDLFILRLLNVGNIICRGAKLEVKGIEPNGSSGDINFYRVTDPLPRYFLATQIGIYNRPETALARISRGDFDPRQYVMIEQKIDFHNHPDNPGRVELKRFRPGQWDFGLTLPMADAEESNQVPRYFLLVGESYMPGWRAFSGVREFKVVRADYVFMGVALPSGDYGLRLVYKPWQTRIGLYSAFASLGFWMILGLGWFFQHKMIKVGQIHR